MNEIKVCFLSYHFQSPEIFLDTLKKMTPNCSGKWKNMTAITDPMNADYCLVFDNYLGIYPHKRTIYFGQHPYVEEHSPYFRTFQDRMNCVARFSLDKYFNPGEWWIKHTYDELMALEPPKKIKKLACIMTYQTHKSMYEQRVKFMQTFTKQCKDYDLYGRPEEKFRANPDFTEVYKGALGHNKPDGLKGEHLIGKELLIDYRYSLEFDVGPTRNYLSERFYDALLLWTMPIYFGSQNVHEYISSNAFHYVNIYDSLDTTKVINIINSDSREQNITAMKEARDLLLNKYQTWPYVHEIVNNLDKYRRK